MFRRKRKAYINKHEFIGIMILWEENCDSGDQGLTKSLNLSCPVFPSE